MNRRTATHTKQSRRQKGFALAGTLVATVVLAIIAVATLGTMNQDATLVNGDINMGQALYAAEAGANRAAEAYWVGYAKTDPRYRVQWLDTHAGDFDQFNVILSDADFNGTYTVQTVATLPTEDPDERLFVIEATGRAGQFEKTVTRVVRYGLGRSKIFDYVYFINNYGWFYGSTIRANGDVRANGNFQCKYDPLVNGDIYAAVNSEIGAPGEALGNARNQTLSEYRDTAESHYRPAYPDAKHGYDGGQDRFSYQEELYMPWLDDISRYETLAHARNGTVSIGGSVVVNQVSNTKTVLIGTAANPIVLNGPVVIKGDVAIKGVIRGQGTIYAERNVHIIGDIRYETPPMWPHDGTDIQTVAEHNANADFLGLASRGSVILGDYTESAWSTVKNYIKPSFTSGYTDENGQWFNGDYTALDGGTKDGGSGRRYFESSWSDTYFGSIATCNITRVDGLMYTNHLFGGRTGDVDFNGTIISRDEAIIFSGNADLNYDYRAREEGESYIDIDLPKAPRMTQLLWIDRPFFDDQGQPNPEFHSVLPSGFEQYFDGSMGL